MKNEHLRTETGVMDYWAGEGLPMDQDLFSRNLPTDPTTLLETLTLRLTSVCEQIRVFQSRPDLHIEKEQLLQLSNLIDDLPRRQDQYTQSESQYRLALEKLLQQKTEIVPFVAPAELMDRIALHRRQLQALEVYTSHASSTGQTTVSFLDESHRAAIAERTTSLQRAKHHADSLAYKQTKMWHDFYNQAMRDADRRWEQCLGSARNQVFRLEEECRKLEADHTRKLRLEAQQELASLKSRVDTVQADLVEATAAMIDKPQIEQQRAYYRNLLAAQELLTQLKDLYKQDSAYFTPKRLSDIKSAKYRAGLMTQEETRDYVKILHEQKLTSLGKMSKGVRTSTRKRRTTRCYACKESLDNAIDVECIACGWIICICGACGCGYTG